jgi:hypothetical protein
VWLLGIVCSHGVRRRYLRNHTEGIKPRNCKPGNCKPRNCAPLDDVYLGATR